MAVRIVLADDHALVRRELRKLLEAEEDWLVCGEADSGTEAVRLCETLQPHVAVLDITMPRLTGIEAAKRIQQIVPAIAVVIVSSHVDEGQMRAAALEAGARACISKRDAPTHLVRAIRALLQPDLT
jgi:DNA-binding NarL/FixJ family response regulator